MLFPSNLKSDVARDDLQERLLVQHSITTVVATLFGIVATLFQHCSNIAMMYCAQNRRCESYRVTSPLMFLEAEILGKQN